jgi:Fe-S-cluster containining protein
MKTNIPNILNEKILKDYQRLNENDTFEFACHSGVPCFNKCCHDVNIFLTPYDIIRLKNRLGISSGEFLDKYTLLPIDENLRHPIVMLKMDEDNHACPFVSEKGCTVYEDRPWSCRMYPVGEATPNMNDNEDSFYFLLKEDVCKGYNEKGKKWTIKEWMKDQGVYDYILPGERFKQVSLHDFFAKADAIEPVKLEMFYMVCYDIDKFRSFVFESTFLKRFIVEEEEIELMKNDDLELLLFGFRWLRYSLFGEKVLDVNEEYAKPTA